MSYCACRTSRWARGCTSPCSHTSHFRSSSPPADRRKGTTQELWCRYFKDDKYSYSRLKKKGKALGNARTPFFTPPATNTSLSLCSWDKVEALATANDLHRQTLKRRLKKVHRHSAPLRTRRRLGAGSEIRLRMKWQKINKSATFCVACSDYWRKHRVRRLETSRLPSWVHSEQAP